MKRCRFYLHGRPSQFLTDLYGALEERNPNLGMIHDILKEYDVIQQYNGKMFIYQGEDSSIALNHVRRINRRYPNLIEYEYKGQTTNRFGKGLNEKYTFKINTSVLNSIKNMTLPEDIQQIYVEEAVTAAEKQQEEMRLADQSLSERIRKENTSENKNRFAKEETRSESEKKADKLKKHFKNVGVDIRVEYTNNLASNVSADITGTGPRSADIRVNNSYFQEDDVYHEFGHAYIDLLGMNNPLVKQALKELKGSFIEAKVLETYPNLKGDKLKREILATAIGVEGAKIENKNPSKLQIIFNRIFRAIGKLLGIGQNAAAQLAEQMFAGSMRSELFVGSISGFTQESKDNSKLQKKINDVKIYTRQLKKIAESRNDSASKARAESLAETLENIKSLEDFTSFIDISAKVTSTISNKYNLLEKKLREGEKLDNKDMSTVSELHQYIKGFDILEGLETLFHDESATMPKRTTAFDSAYNKLGAVVRQRKSLEAQYLRIIVPAQADFLTPYISQEVNADIDSLIQNIKDQEDIDVQVLTANRHLDKKDLKYIALEKALKENRTTEDEYKQDIIDLTIEQLENSKAHKDKLVEILTRAHKDTSTFSFWLDPMVWSNDNAIQLFALAVKDALYKGDEKSRDLTYEVQELYNDFTKGVTGVNNVKKLYTEMIEAVDTWVRNEDGSYKQIKRAALIQDIDMNRYQKNKQAAVEKAKNETYFRERKDFESEELFEEYLNSIDNYKGENGKIVYRAQTRKELYNLTRRAFGEAMGKWRNENTVPIPEAQAIMSKHESKIAGVYKKISPLRKKVDAETITDLELDELNSLEIELSNLESWRQSNYYVNPRYPDSLTPKGSLVKPSQGEKMAGNKKRANYSNPKYAAIMSDPRKKKFYEGMSKIYKESQEKLGSAGHQLGKTSFGNMAYSLPSIRKIDKDRAIEQGILPTMKEWWIDGLDITETDKHIYGQEWESIGGKERKIVPALYTNPIDMKDTSLDLTASILQFAAMANTYEAKANIQGQVQTMVDIIESRQTDLTSPSGIKIMNQLAKGLGIEQPRSKEGYETNSFKHLISFLDQNYYDQKTIKHQFAFLGKQFELNKLSGKLAGYTAMNALAFNLLQGFNQSVLDNIIGWSEAAAGQFIDRKSAIKGKQEYWKAGGAISDLGKMAPTSFVGQLNDEYDIIQGNFKDNVGKNKTGSAAKKLFTSDALFFLQHGAEHEIQVSRGLGMLAFMKAKDKDGNQLKNKDGSDMTMLDAHSQVNGRLKIDDRVANFDKMRFINRLHGINKRTNGVYNDFDSAHLKRHWYGKLVMLFRGWMVPGYRKRFGHGETWHADHEIGALTQGNYVTFYKMLRDSIKTQSNQYKNMSEVEKQNVRRTMVEVNAFIGTLLLGFAAALLIDDDDDEPNSWALNFLLYQNRRLQSELLFYLHPGETWRLIKSPTATVRPLEHIGAFALSTLENIYYFSGNLGGLVPEKHIYYQRKSGLNKKGELKWDNKLYKMAPALKGIINSKTPGEAIKWFNM
tara:strand:+ start:15562 stop:20097 length:4536 start_codon:yes stop_codon:yes gene_type:complete